MRGFFIFSLFLFCFSLQAEVVCKDPNSAVGDEVAEAGSSPSICRKNVTDASQGAVDRVNVANYLDTLGSDTEIIKTEGEGEDPRPPAEGGASGSTTGSIN